MIIDGEIRSQLNDYLKLMEGDVKITLSVGEDEHSKDMSALVDEIATMSEKIKVEGGVLERTPSFTVDKPNLETGIVFSGVPLGHEFSSLVLALLQVSGRAPKVEPSSIERIKAIKGQHRFETYVSLTCHNCPEVVQALNLMSLINPEIQHTMIDGGVFREEVEQKEIMGVPAVFLNGEFFGGGRLSLEEILDKLGEVIDPAVFSEKEPFDVLVVGGGPAGASAAIYAARKGIRTGLIAERFGGQVQDTLGVENLIGTLYTEGPQISASLDAHVKAYEVDVMNQQRVSTIRKQDYVEVELTNGAVLKSKTVILATGARWRNVGVSGEEAFKNKGVAYCPHCDGPLFKGKDVAVIGGGNSGIEAAIDLAGMVKHVTVLEFMPELKADAVLQNRLYSLPNVTVLKNVQTKEITGTDKVDGIAYVDRATGAQGHIPLQGVFVQIGLIPNTEWLEGILDRNKMGEILVNEKGMTSMSGVFAAGDCTNSAFKQIIISMGSGATAALGAFDYMMRTN
jgi:alkyl hydroperoxide reductase subunit F